MSKKERLNLADYFPVIRSREEILDDIRSNAKLYELYSEWTPREQEDFLDFCSGMRGVKVLYDGFLKKFLIRSMHRPD